MKNVKTIELLIARRCAALFFYEEKKMILANKVARHTTAKQLISCAMDAADPLRFDSIFFFG